MIAPIKLVKEEIFSTIYVGVYVVSEFWRKTKKG
jgi:hypothetical protein